MIVYHVDRMCSLVPGQIILRHQSWPHPDSRREQRIRALNRLFGGKLTFFGVQSLDAFPEKSIGIEAAELVLDYVRALHFPDLPSRFTVLFASRTAESALQWFLPLSLRDCKPQLLSLETHRPVYAANALFRDEVGNRIAALFSESHVDPERNESAADVAIPASNLAALGSSCLVHCMEPALEYWHSLRRVRHPGNPALYPREELLLIPPVRVVDRVFP